MKHLTLLCFLTLLYLSAYCQPPPAPPLSPEELARLHAVKAWDIEFTYHFTDTRAGSGDVPSGAGCGIGIGPIDHWTVSHNNEDQYVVKFTVAGKNGQSDCAPGSDSCLTKYEYPGSITETMVYSMTRCLSKTSLMSTTKCNLFLIASPSRKIIPIPLIRLQPSATSCRRLHT